MKKIFPLFIVAIMVVSLFACLPNSASSMALEIGKYATIIASRCELYESADFSSNKITISVDGQTQNYYLKHGETVEVLSEENDFVKILSADNIEGWAYKYYLTQNNSQAVYPVFNATIRNDSILYDMDLQNSGHSVTKNQRVYVYKSFSEKENYTAVQVVLDNQSLYNGYVQTKDVQPDGISGLLIAGISIICAGVTVVLSIVFIKKKKKKK